MKRKISNIFLVGLIMAVVFAVAVPMNVSAGNGSVEVKEEWVVRYDGQAAGYEPYSSNFDMDGADAIAMDGSGNVYIAGRSNEELLSFRVRGNAQAYQIVRSSGSQINDGETITLTDGLGVTETFEFDKDGSFTPGNVPVSISDADSYETVATALSNAIVANLDMINYRPHYLVYGYIALQQNIFGAAGDTPVTETVADPNFRVNNFSGGEVNAKVMRNYYSVLVVKYLPDGTEDWVAHYNTPVIWDYSNPTKYPDGYPSYTSERAFAIALDSAGNVYVGGLTATQATSLDALIVKFNSDGTLAWAVKYGGSQGGNSQQNLKENDLVVDTSGNVYAAVPTVLAGDRVVDIVKYDSVGNMLWEKTYSSSFIGPQGEQGCVGSPSIALDSAGNAYIAADEYYFPSGGGIEYLPSPIIKYAVADGSVLWEKDLGPSNEFPMAIAVDSFDNVIVSGGNGADCLTKKFDSAGNLQWSTTWDGGGGGPGNDQAKHLATDVDDNVYVGANVVGDLMDWDAGVIKYDANGNELWSATYDGPGPGPYGDNSWDNSYGMALDACGNAYLTGWSHGETGHRWDRDYFTIKFDGETGDRLWLETFGEPQPYYDSDDQARDIVVDLCGNVYVTGRSWTGYGPSATEYDATTIKYSQGPVVALENLIAVIKGMDLQEGIHDSLGSILENTVGSINNGQDNAAVNQLNAFINLVEAFRGKKLADGEADSLIAAAQWIIDNLTGE